MNVSIKKFLTPLSATLLLLATLVLSPLSLFAEKIKIGVSVPLTGPGVSYGQDVKNVILFANELLGRDRFELIIEDDQCNPKAAVAVAKKFIFIDKVAAVIGLPCSGTVFAAGPLYDTAKIPTISSLASASKISNLGPFIFRTRPSDFEASKTLFSHTSKTFKRQAVLAEKTDFAQSLADDYEANNSKKLVSIQREDFTSGEADFRPILLRLKNQNVDSLVIFTQTEASFGNILKQLRTINLSVPLFGAIIPGSKVFLDAHGKDAEGLVYVSLPELDSLLTTEGKNLLQKYLQKYGPLNGMHFSFPVAFESFNALQSAEQNGAINLELLSNKTFEGLFGRYIFDKNGDISGIRFVLHQIRNGRTFPLGQASP